MGGAVTEDWKGLYQNTGVPFKKVKRESSQRFRGHDPAPDRYTVTTKFSNCCEVAVGRCVEMHPDADYS